MKYHKKYQKKKTDTWLKKGKRRQRGKPWPWREIFLPSVPAQCRYILVYNRDEQEVPLYGLSQLSRMFPTGETALAHSPLLVPPEAGFTQFGLLGLPQGIPLPAQPSLVTLDMLCPPRWAFALEWKGHQTAWEAVLDSEDHLDPLIISLKPTYVLPALFVARMANQPPATRFETVMAWVPLLEEAQEHLCDLIGTLYLFWLDGPSQTAQAFRADEEEDEEPLDEEITIALQDVRHTIEQLVGAECLEAFLHAERLVPAVLRFLDETSRSLWNGVPHARYQSLLSTHDFLRALLPIALWNPQTPITLEKDILHDQPWSLEHLYALWQARLCHDV